MKTIERTPGWRNGTVVFGIVIGLVIFGAAAYAGQPGLGAAMLAIMLGYVALLWRGQRVDVIQVLRGEPADERYEQMLSEARELTGRLTASCRLSRRQRVRQSSRGWQR